jgi:5-methylcytosine-specific restriction endonuclease McrA
VHVLLTMDEFYRRVADPRTRERNARVAAARSSCPFKSWQEVLDYYGNQCLRCRRRGIKLTRDHVIPKSQGGSNSLGNMQPLCEPCNRWKADRVADYRPRFEREKVAA